MSTMANTIESKALFHLNPHSAVNGAINYDTSTSSSDALISTAYPSLALYVLSDRWNFLRAKSAEPVWREWLLNQPLDYGSVPYNPNKEADSWTREALKSVRQRLQENTLGIFSPAFGRFQQSSGNGDGISVTRYFADSPIAKPFPNLNWHEAFQELSKAIRDGVLGNNAFNVTLGSGNDIVLPGWQGNSTTSTGPGDDIILSSPQVHVAELYDTHYRTSIGADYREWDAYVYYPTAYAAKGTSLNSKGNTFDAGPGKDLIYYDAGVESAKGGDGDDILAPSFASFNWGLDHLFQGSGLNASPDERRSLGFGEPQVTLYNESLTTPTNYAPYAKTFVRGERALISPLRNLKQAQKVATSHTSGYDYGLDGYEFNALNRELSADQLRIIIRTSDKPDGVNFGLKKDASNKIAADDNEINIIGGSKLIGGKGRDLFYGIDPQLYAGFTTAADGQGLRLAFRNNSQADSTSQPPRYNAQELRGVEMFGGSESDYFALGNPRNIEPWSIAPGYEYLYRISGNADAFNSKEDDRFGTNAAPDVFEVNLTYAGDNWKNTVTSAPGDAGAAEAPSALDLAGLGVNGLSALGLVAGGFGINVPIFTALTAVGSFALGIASLAKPTPKQPISTDNTYYRDPIGHWRQKISIQDWDPSDSLVIRIDPSDPSALANRRWDNINLSFTPGNDSSNNQFLDLNYQLAGDATAKTLFRLESIKDSASSGAWYGWDFTRTKPGLQEIGESNLGLFGQVEMQSDSEARQDPDLSGYTDQYGFSVEPGTRLFRWNDTTLSNDVARLSRMKGRSERIVAQLDTMTLGYSWAPRFTGTVSSTADRNPTIQGLSLDKEASKLWIRQDGPDGNPVWTAYSYNSIETDPASQALARKATPVWSRQVPAATELQTNLAALDAEMTGGLDQLIHASSNDPGPLAASRGTELKPEQFELSDLNTIKDIIIEGGQENKRAVVYYESTRKNTRGTAILKTVIDNNVIYPAYGLNAKQLKREESELGQDVDGDGLIAKMATNAAG